jgi:hypothetical protein
VRAVEKFLVDRVAAVFARESGLFFVGPSMALKNILRFTALLANREGLTLFDSQNRDKKYAQVMVNPRLICLVQTADSAPLRVIPNSFAFGGYAGNQKKHAKSSPVCKQPP